MLEPLAYLDPRSGRTWKLDPPRWCGDAQEPLLLTELPGLTPERIDRGTRSLWRYRGALPPLAGEPITLGEGCTPLVPREVAGATALLKCEWLMPSGSFKDRGASVMLSLLRAQGVQAVLEDSSGNGGAAIATYAAAGGMRAKIMVPASTSPTKTVQNRAAGAEIELVPGSRQDCADAALRESANIFYASHNWHPFFLQGTKTLAYELWEDLGFQAPDNVIVPCGAGSNVLGCGIGFHELLAAGQIGRMPRIFAAQPAHCAPIARAFLGLEPVAPQPTLAEGTAIAQPLRMAECLGVLRQSLGGAVMLSEAEIAGATRDLALSGIYVEPTSAQAAAAFAKLLQAGTINPEEKTVVVLTGSGLKATPRIAELMGMAL
ncbi:pyridoxal-phosphate dependent enzyme [Siccirubricoccus sp. KC 17139]|uniref:Pyridoxal-phosphate dependent enzyme n=1 Tax=Siccirubricoccus soli TaxID=2899147 RepID=A0ABT1D6M7_9PROT|nr:pyridoxal-phosphate dependent enzyme [Siccirubricoccus soli]MCO6417529.1 pyridoxal-phosphate dependent enzyme [Siccirubricoccus soli]MCP2683664.1 pyridoxal-phosphate dependent enzyme [Siccirubricoccus soli]